jgi:hypothetical protein
MSQVAAAAADEETAGWYLYRFYAPTSVRCAVAGCTLRHPLYIGKSNEPWRREREHARKMGWYHLALLPGGGWMIDERTFETDGDVRAAELDAIAEELPLANEDGNERNEHRLIFPKVVRPARLPSARRVPAEPKPAKRRVVSKRRKDLAWKTAGWVAGWAALTVVVSLIATRWLGVALWPGGQVFAVASAVVVAAVRVATLSKAQRKTLWRWTVGTALAAAAVGVVWLVFAQHAAEAGAR